jgi:hypothetical protein
MSASFKVGCDTWSLRNDRGAAELASAVDGLGSPARIYELPDS